MKKGLTLSEFSSYAMLFVVVAIIIAISGTILVQVQTSQCTGGSAGYTAGSGCGTGGSSYNTSTLASNITGQGLSGMTTLGNWLPTIAVIISAAVVIGIIVNYFRQ